MGKFRKAKLSRLRFKIGAVALAVLAIIGVSALAIQTTSKKAIAAADSAIYFTPASNSVGLNADFTLDAMINPGTNLVNGVSLQVSFDSSKFRLDSVDASGTLFTVTMPGGFINNTNGTATTEVGVYPGNPSVTSTAKVATLSFHSLATAANSPIAFSNSAYAVATGEGGDVLTTRTPAAVTVTGVTYDNNDFAALVTDWLHTGSSPADVNSDNVVNTRDLGIMMSNWQQ